MRHATAAPPGTYTFVQKIEPGTCTFCSEVCATICFAVVVTCRHGSFRPEHFLEPFSVRGVFYNSVLKEPFRLVFDICLSILFHFGVMGPILEPGRQKDTKTISKGKTQ